MSCDADMLIRTGAGGDLDDVVELYRAVGWTRYADDPAVLSQALSGSSRVVTAYRSGRLVGLARVISDGATICFYRTSWSGPTPSGPASADGCGTR